MNEYRITADSFGADIPENWEQIAEYLNRRIDEMELDSLPERERHDAVNELWEEFWSGAIRDVDGLTAFLNAFTEWDESQSAALDELAEIAGISRDAYIDYNGMLDLAEYVRAIEDALQINIGGR